MEVTRNNQM